MEQALTKLLYQPAVRKHLSLLIVGFTLGVLVFGFIKFDQIQDQTQSLLSGLLGVVITYLAFYSNTLLNALLPWKQWTGIRLLAGILWNSGSGYLLVLLGVGLYPLVLGKGKFSGAMAMDTQLKLGILLFCAALIYNVAYFAFYSYNYYTTQQLAELRTQREQAELQLAALKSQLSPHFLFNCMNSLSALFQSDISRAETFIRAMAKSYQYTLENYRSSLIKVKEELEFVNSYGFLLKTRYGEGFQLKVNLEAAQLEGKIPPLTLQILVENALKHNAVGASHPILVSITGHSNTLQVSNNKIPVKVKKSSTGIGLKNIASRYSLLSGSRIKIEDATHFTVTLPLLS